MEQCFNPCSDGRFSASPVAGLGRQGFALEFQSLF